MMRFDTHAYRVRHGVPIFVTFTPDEAHNTVMLRLSRARRGDPVVGEGGDPIARKLHGRFTPAIDTTPEDDVELTLDPPSDFLPSYYPTRKELPHSPATPWRASTGST